MNLRARAGYDGAADPRPLLSPTTHIMGFIFWIIVGIVAGFLAEKLMKADMGLLMNLVLGIVGALVGGFLINTILGFGDGEGLIESIVVATLGAMLVLFVANKLKERGVTT